MSLRQKTLLIIGLLLLTTAAALFLTSRFLLLNSYEELEDQAMQENLERGVNALYDNRQLLSHGIQDWAYWDEAYQYALKPNQAFIDSNVYSVTFEAVDLDSMVFLNQENQIIYNATYDRDLESLVPISEGFAQVVLNNDKLHLANDPEANVSGVLLLPEGIMLVAARPILNNNRDLPPAGTLIWGRYLTQVRINELAAGSKLDMQIYRTDQTLPDDVQAIRKSLSDEIWTSIKPLNRERIAAYALLDDLNPNSALIIRVESQRDIYQRGSDTLTYFLAALGIIGVIFIIVLMISLETVILSRLGRLNREISEIGTSGNPAPRVTVKGVDELSQLAQASNATFSTLQLTQQTLSAAKDAAEAASRTKSTFLANMSHELRTPLNAIIGYSALIAEGIYGEVSDTQKDRLHRITDNSQHLLALINNVLDLSKIEAGKLGLELEYITVVPLIEEIAGDIRPVIAANENTLTILCPPDIGSIYADKIRVRQVLINLLSNATKFTKAGQISLRTRREGAFVCFEVQDTGIGIPADQLGTIFEEFTQVDTSTTRQYGGTGLGLAITRQLCHLMGGEVWAESMVGVGSTFYVQFPAQAPKYWQGEKLNNGE